MFEPEKLTGKTYVLSSEELDILVKEHIPWLNDYKFVDGLDWSESSTGNYYLRPEITKRFKHSITKALYLEFVNEKNKNNRNSSDILRYLVLHNILPPGNYIIRVSW